MKARQVLLLVAFASTATSAAWAEGPDKRACATAYDAAQYARRDGKLRQAREQLLVCTQPSCGAEVSADCSRWLGEVEAAIPSVVLIANDDAGREVEATATVDDDPRPVPIDGRAMPIDPGTHVFRFRSHGRPPADTTVLVHEGEKAKRVIGTFRTPAVSRVVAPAPTRVGFPLWPSVAFGVGALAFGGASLGVGLVAQHDLDALRATGCAPNCSSATTNGICNTALVSDVLMGVAIASLATAVVFFIVHRAHDTRAAAADFRIVF